MNATELKQRTKDFAHRCVKLSMALPQTALGNHIRGQLIRCSTSVAANYRSACIAQSKASFACKLSIAFEEADETCFWLEFIIDEKLMKHDRLQLLLAETKELTSILASARKTSQRKK